MAARKEKDKALDEVKGYLDYKMGRIEEMAAEFTWPWEIRRWHELVYCLAVVIACPPLPSGRMRELVYIFADLGFLEIPLLAAFHAGTADPESKKVIHTAIHLLEREGLPASEAQRMITTIAEAAFVLEKQYDGKVQKYLRSYGEMILKDVGRKFDFSQLDGDTARLAFSYWIQNVLNMPVGVSIPAIRALCEKFGISETDLQEAADDMGLNLALLDDIASEMDEG